MSVAPGFARVLQAISATADRSMSRLSRIGHFRCG